MSRRKKSERLEKVIPDRGGRSRGLAGGLRRTAAVLAAVAFLGAVLAAGLVVRDRPSGGAPSGPRTAVIVDQLSLTQPNPAFVESATDTLEQAGYAVDYYPGEEVTVDFYRDLPSRRYDLVLLRVHGGRVMSDDGRRDYVGLFTSEPYRETGYVEEQRARRLVVAWYFEGSPAYFGILPDFVTQSMRGTFGGATVILMTCDGLRSEETAQAFVQKGAKEVVGWSDLVSAPHTDAATERLLRYLLIDGLPTREAVAKTKTEVGPDPFYGGTIRLYQGEEAALAIP